MKLVHYSDKEITQILALDLTPLHFKPRGLWVSDDDCDDSWWNWCASEGFNEGRLSYAHEIEVAEAANLLIIQSENSIDGFTATFKRPGTDEHDIFQIDWDRVREMHDGIVITPYVWSRRLALSWYYAWDCASGCIWNPEVVMIKSVTVTEAVGVK